MPQQRPFDAVLVIAFGGPLGPQDVRPFLANVLRGRRVPPHRIDEVAANYERFGGVSPLTEITRRQAAGLQERLASSGMDLPVYVGMRNWHPLLADTLREMSERGHRRAIGFIAAAHHSYSSCQQYKENVRDANRQIIEQGYEPVAVTYVDSWYDHPLFIETIARHISAAIERLEPARSVHPETRKTDRLEAGPTWAEAGSTGIEAGSTPSSGSTLGTAARIVFTAHSLPLTLSSKCRYVDQLKTSARLAMEKLGRSDWTLVYQSRSGLPTDPWLEPDICDYLRAEHAGGLPAAVIVPIGFICDHIEVLFDLDTQAAQVCREIGLPMVRAATAGDDPLFMDMMADIVTRACRRFAHYPPLPIAHALS